MFGNSSGDKFAVRAEKTAAEETRSESIASERVANARIASELGLDKQLFSREFSLKEGNAKAENSRWQEGLLREGRLEAKDNAQLARQYIRSTSTANTAMPAGEKVASTVGREISLARENSKGETLSANQNTQIAKPVIASPLQLNSAGFDAKTAANIAQSAAFKGNLDAFAHGTQVATKEPQPMSPFYLHSSFDAARDQSRRRGFAQTNEEDNEEVVIASTTVRASAIVETSAGRFQNVSVQETLMPRLQEVIERLNALGQSWARVVVPVDAQTKIIVRFSTAAGRVKISIASEDEGLSQMIRDGWKFLTDECAKNGIALDEPTFEKENYVN